MARPNQEEIETFMSITGVSEATAIQKLEENYGNLNEAVNAHFSAGGRTITNQASFVAPHDDVMDIDDPVQVESRRPPFSLAPSAGDANPFSLLDPNFTRHDRGTDFASGSPFIPRRREVRQIHNEVKDGNGPSGNSGSVPPIEDVTESAQGLGPEIRGTLIVDDDEDGDDNVPNGPNTRDARHHEPDNAILGANFHPTRTRSSAPTMVDEASYSNDIEEEMVLAAIEASKQDVAMTEQQFDNNSDLRDPMRQPGRLHPEDDEFARAVSLSLKTAEQEKVLQEGKIEALDLEAEKSADMEQLGKQKSSSGRQSRLEIGSSSFQNEAEDVEVQPLVRQRNRPLSSDSLEGVEVTPPPTLRDNLHQSLRNGSVFPSDEWGGISSEEHDEAVMLEAAMFGGVPEGSGHNVPYAPHELMQNDLDRSMGLHRRHIPHPPSPSLAAQRLIREQQDDEFLAALQADREKELKAKEEAEAAIAEERQKEEEMRRTLEEEQELKGQLAAKEASLPQEPTPDDGNAVTLLVRMPDGSRMGRRFLKSDKLQYLFDFIDVGRLVKPHTYRLVRPFPRHAFSDGESTSTLNELGLTSKQEALYLELI
ncbi:plant UBX domain-containing protein 8-like isoform X1 [Olea europaea var. sylvestris]|uniref:Plant UBX domain-containing 8-like isoform X1 n=1 Tax=Olea europaea subsp. europaea TaxID=158383 RepID=A0A8S0RD58_OLEEU|nr:plant UBX domain-containing protein 8-like isoform X1 [Olea europaea var. sylvestris]CAA2976527.1 plant UBX domain-containing 8-like isoform X1 [Olea europaea subsp. europaea]